MKYQSEMCKIDNCPPTDCLQKDQMAYRFVFNPIDEKSFLPQGVKQPSRIDKCKNKDDQCSFLGLSFFISEEKAKARYKSLKKCTKNIDKTIGSHIAEGELKSYQGVQTKISKRSGHFDFFEKKNVDLVQQFKIITNLSKE